MSLTVCRNTTNPSLRMSAAPWTLWGAAVAVCSPCSPKAEQVSRDSKKQLDALGGGVSQEFIDRSVEINDNITRWRTAFLSLRSALILNFLPAANNAVTAITRWTAGISRNRELVGLISVGFTALGAIAVAAAVRAAAAWLAAGWPVLLAAVAVGVLTLAVDELWTTWQGGDSILRQFINELFPGVEDGLTTTDQLIVSLTMSAAVLINYLGNLWDIAVGTFDATADIDCRGSGATRSLRGGASDGP